MQSCWVTDLVPRPPYHPFQQKCWPTDRSCTSNPPDAIRPPTARPPTNFTLQTSLVIRLEINIFGTNVWSSIARRPSDLWTFYLVPLNSPPLWLSKPHLGFSFSIDSFCAVFCQRWLHLTTKVNTIRTHLSCKYLRGGADLSKSAERASRAPILTELWPGKYLWRQLTAFC